ncbi:MAG: pseudouridine synthase [Eubacteriales bacterium]|nr:pseudouridine synthase [Eubacteriales bacterium]
MEDLVRLNKYISDSGICSRRQADCLIEQGKITVDGVVADLGARVNAQSVVMYNGRRIFPEKKQVIYAYHKPIGLVCTSADADKDSIFLKANFPIAVNYVGRLDKDSSGLLLLTNDGELANEIQKSKNNHEKEYQVRVNRDLTDEFIQGMRAGVPILDTVTKPCIVKKQGARNFSIVLTQGLNRQIRRMCDYFGYRVVHLKRVRVMNVKLGDLRPGSFRELTSEEECKLRSLVNKQKT